VIICPLIVHLLVIVQNNKRHCKGTEKMGIPSVLLNEQLRKKKRWLMPFSNIDQLNTKAILCLK
jgi:hypothetical protein